MDEQKPGAVSQPANPTELPTPENAKPLVAVELPLTDNTADIPEQQIPSDGWQYRNENTVDPQISDTNISTQDYSENISWTASEFLAHDKSLLWYAVLTGAGVIGSFIVYILTKDVISTIVILLAALLFGVYAGHKPRTLQYTLSRKGLQIGDKLYSLQDFRSFAVTEELANASVVFMPLRRFMPPLTIYVTADLEDKILGYLSKLLPVEQHRQDAIDSLLKRIRF